VKVGAAIAIVAVLALSACSGQTAGSAAIVGDTRITDETISAEVENLLTAQGKSLDDASPSMMATALGRAVTTELVDQVATKEGVTVNAGEIDAVLDAYGEQAGGLAEFEKYLLTQDVAPDQITSIIRLNIQVEKLGLKLAPNESPDMQSLAVFQIVGKYSEEVGVEISPRYGSWDPANLTIGPPPDDLSTPN
jgi:hypothetical protein